MQQKYQKGLLPSAWICAFLIFGCAEITVDEMPVDIDDQTSNAPDNTNQVDDDDVADSDSADPLRGTDSSETEDTGNVVEETDFASDPPPATDTDVSPDTVEEQETGDEPIADTETTPPNKNDVATDDPATQDSETEDLGGGDSGYLCGTTPIFTSVTPNSLFSIDSADYGIGQSFKFPSSKLRAMEIVLSETKEDLGPHVIELVRGEPGEFSLLGYWEVDVPLDPEFYTSVCLGLGDFVFDTTQVYSFVVRPHADTWEAGDFAIAGEETGTYPGGRAWYKDASGVWYATTTDLYFVLY